MIVDARGVVYQDDCWPPAWGLLAALCLSLLMWWALLSGVLVMARAFMS